MSRLSEHKLITNLKTGEYFVRSSCFKYHGEDNMQTLQCYGSVNNNNLTGLSSSQIESRIEARAFNVPMYWRNTLTFFLTSFIHLKSDCGRTQNARFTWGQIVNSNKNESCIIPNINTHFSNQVLQLLWMYSMEIKLEALLRRGRNSEMCTLVRMMRSVAVFYMHYLSLYFLRV